MDIRLCQQRGSRPSQQKPQRTRHVQSFVIGGWPPSPRVSITRPLLVDTKTNGVRPFSRVSRKGHYDTGTLGFGLHASLRRELCDGHFSKSMRSGASPFVSLHSSINTAQNFSFVKRNRPPVESGHPPMGGQAGESAGLQCMRWSDGN